MSRYFEILFRHRLRFVILLFLLPLEVAAAVVLVFPHDSATSSLWVDTPAYFGVSAAATGWNQYLTPAQNTVDAMTQLTNTNAFLRSLATSLYKANINMSKEDYDTVFATFSTDMKITVSGSHLVILNYTCGRKAICLAVLSGTTQIYRDWLAVEQQAQAKVAIDFYTGQLADAQTKLQADQTALSKYMTQNPTVKPTDVATNPDLDQLIRAVSTDRADVNSLQSKLDGLKLTDAAAVEINNTNLNVVDPPRITGGTLSSLPRKQLAIAMAAVFALAAAVLVIMAWSDRNVRDPKELQARLRIPVVSTIPDLSAKVASRG
jgi:hypothetical protein